MRFGWAGHLARLAVACALVLMAAGAGCGGGSGKENGSKQPAAPGARTATARTQTHATATQPRPEATPKPPEQQPGGAGDEQPARVPASFTGRAGLITPRAVHVPPYIAVGVELRSADGRPYGLRFGGRLLRAGGGRGSDSATLSGLRPGRSLRGTPIGGGNAVRIVADAEPGP